MNVCMFQSSLWLPNVNKPICDPMFTRSEVIVLSNKQTNRRHWKHPTLFATLWRWV